MRSARSTTHRRGLPGFTLIELLVTVAIIGILAVLLFPVISRALENARRAGCRENLKQIGMAMRLFANDNKGWFPWGSMHPDVDLAGGGAAGQAGVLDRQGNLQVVIARTNTQFGQLYTGTTKVWICPSDKYDGSGNDTPVTPAASFSPQVFDRSKNCSYMYVVGYSDWWSQRYQMPPSLAPILTDEANQPENGNLQADDMPEITAEDNHGANFRNVLFLDGHVTQFDKADAANAIFDGILASTNGLRVLQSLD